MLRRILPSLAVAVLVALGTPIAAAHAATPVHLAVDSDNYGFLTLSPSQHTTTALTMTASANGIVLSSVPIDVSGRCTSLGLTPFGYGADCGTLVYALVTGGDGNDTITVKNIPAQVFGNGGNDTITMNDNNAAHQGTVVHGGNGRDNITLSGAAFGGAYGEAGNDTLRSTGGSHYLDGGMGADTIYGYDGAAEGLNCGQGLTGSADIATDTVHYDASLDNLTYCNSDTRIANS